MPADSELAEVSPDEVRPNPDNPRLIFREEDMQILLDSIHSVGIKVPLTVYEERGKYRILDGERRWRCAKKLNLRTIPVIIQPKPSKLENLLTMFNIHNVRVDWDMIATATKLGEVQDLLTKAGDEPTIANLANLTGLSKPMVRNCLELLDLPSKFIKLLFAEAAKPRAEQRITPDLFIEINKSERVIRSYAPEALEGVTPRDYLERMVRKYQSGAARSITSFRSISKIARAERAGASLERAVPVLQEFIQDRSYTIDEAFDDSVAEAYEQRDIASRAEALLQRLSDLKSKRRISASVRAALTALRDRITELLGER